MILLKYVKEGEAIYLPHLDMLRHMTRTLRRAEIQVEYSAGYHPHMNLYFAPPLPIGLASRCEYLAVDTAVEADDFLRRYNDAASDGLHGVSCLSVVKNPNVAALVTHARYCIHQQGVGARADEIQALVSRSDTVMRFDRQGKTIEIELAGKCEALEFTDDSFEVTLPCVRNNVRPDKLAKFLSDTLGLLPSDAQTRLVLYTQAQTTREDIDTYVAKQFAQDH